MKKNQSGKIVPIILIVLAAVGVYLFNSDAINLGSNNEFVEIEGYGDVVSDTELADGWFLYRSEEGNFEVELPVVPDVWSQTVIRSSGTESDNIAVRSTVSDREGVFIEAEHLVDVDGTPFTSNMAEEIELRQNAWEDNELAIIERTEDRAVLEIFDPSDSSTNRTLVLFIEDYIYAITYYGPVENFNEDRWIRIAESFRTL